jgi:hypothetical protein
MSSALTAASAAADYGWQVFPAHPTVKKSYKSKEHNGRNWGMTSDAAEIKADFTRWPDARIGIPTGAVNGFIVIETDTIEGHGVDGSPGLHGLEARYGALPETRRVMSPSGSVHRYFLHPGKHIKIPNNHGVIAPGVDVKGDGGMVIGAGSVNPDGRAYRLVNANPIAALPNAWIDLLKEKKPTIRERATAAVNAHRVVRMVRNGGGNAYARAALRSEIEALSNAAPLTRNTALNKAAFSLCQLVHGGLLDFAEVERQLLDACVANGARDTARQITATIKSAFDAAASKPRRGFSNEFVRLSAKSN